MKIRDATIADLDAIVAIYNSTIPSRMVTADLDPVSPESRMAWFSVHGPERRPLWIMESDTGTIGWLSFSDFHERPAYRAAAEVSIYLDQSVRGQGLGGVFLQRAVDAAPALGIKNLLALVLGHNMPSLKLFERHGFKVWAHLPQVAELDGVERDLLILGRRV